MDPTTLITAVGAVCSIFGTGLGIILKAVVDWTGGRRKQYLDQLQVSIEESRALRVDLDKQREQIHNLQLEVKELSVAKAKHEVEAIHFRRDITDLQRQVRSLGHVPVVPDHNPEVTSGG